MIQSKRMSDDDYRKMYNGLKKKQLIEILIDTQKMLKVLMMQNQQPEYPELLIEKKKVPYNTICGCNPSNGGDGICGCTMGNQIVEVNPTTNIPHFRTTTTFGTRNEDC